MNIDADEVLVGDIPELKADIGIVLIGEWGIGNSTEGQIGFKYHKECITGEHIR